MKPWLEIYTGDDIDGLLALEEDYRVDSLVVALEQRLSLKDSHSPPEQVVLSLCDFDREVNNGGFHQYLTNSSRLYAHRLASDLETVGLGDGAQRVRAVLGLVGLPPVPVGDDGDDWLDDGRFEDVLEDFDRYYFSSIADCSELVWTWVKANRTQIILG